ncbi:purine and uridine phosphorylase [Aspergillus taichungensis]|uniref:Purine and uridine phosphorylase n=1 Tax=Aspergillus taichungensis TaxID=482145 RepID=A0A2J5I741_9EURO|nr:purine and uridine phosphorylase [Aspergillus taichungensis]
MASHHPQGRDAFDVAVFCSLPLEGNAVESVFDEVYDDVGDIYGKSPYDENAYFLGRIGHHNVVLVYMSYASRLPAARSALHLQSSFPNVTLALAVGICGGAPRNPDGRQIFLGDVVVSHSIVPYDLGSPYGDAFNLDDRPHGPNLLLSPQAQTLLAEVQSLSHSHLVGSRHTQHLAAAQSAAGMEDSAYPGADHDMLYTVCTDSEQPGVQRQEDGFDSTIDPGTRHTTSSGVRRRSDLLKNPDEHPEPSIHIGLVASGDSLVRSATYRDRLWEECGVVGFDMESAGLGEVLPCLVVKGVADYADSHKDRRWQNYAAASAAAGMKAVLELYSDGDSSSPSEFTAMDLEERSSLPRTPTLCARVHIGQSTEHYHDIRV